MPRDVSLVLPFAREANPRKDLAVANNLDWVRRVGLIEGEAAVERYLFSQVAESAAHFYPTAEIEELGLAFDIFGWFFLLDDVLDTFDERVSRAAIAACEEMIDLLCGSASAPRPDSSPLVKSFFECWQRSCEGMGPQWCARAALNWAEYLAGNITEAVDRGLGVSMRAQDFSSDAYLRLRRKTIGIRSSIDLDERLRGREVPSRAWHSSLLEEMRLLAIDQVTYVNEIFSLEKDEARSDVNLVHVVMHENGCDRDEAIRQLVEAADTNVRELAELTGKVDAACDQLALDAAERAAVESFTEVLHSIITGNVRWSTGTRRYSSAAVQLVVAEQTGLLHLTDLV